MSHVWPIVLKEVCIDSDVSGATGMAKKLYECGLGEWTQDIKAPDGKNGYEMKPGDVMSINGHVSSEVKTFLFHFSLHFEGGSLWSRNTGFLQKMA